MWIINQYGNAVNQETGQEFYITYSSDGLYRVYSDLKVIATFRKNSDAVKFIRQKVELLNKEEESA